LLITKNRCLMAGTQVPRGDRPDTHRPQDISRFAGGFSRELRKKRPQGTGTAKFGEECRGRSPDRDKRFVHPDPPELIRFWKIWESVSAYRQAAFITAPSMATSAVTYFHSATSSLRACATIGVFSIAR
jgi:hypothetical protein